MRRWETCQKKTGQDPKVEVRVMDTTPGLIFIYVHLNRVIKQHDLNVIYVTGPGHGGPGLVDDPPSRFAYFHLR